MALNNKPGPHMEPSALLTLVINKAVKMGDRCRCHNQDDKFYQDYRTARVFEQDGWIEEAFQLTVALLTTGFHLLRNNGVVTAEEKSALKYLMKMEINPQRKSLEIRLLKRYEEEHQEWILQKEREKEERMPMSLHPGTDQDQDDKNMKVHSAKMEGPKGEGGALSSHFDKLAVNPPSPIISCSYGLKARRGIE